MNVMDAANATMRDYPGGAESLAPRMGMRVQILRNKCNPNSKVNRLAIDEASAMMTLSRDYRMLHALAAEHGFAVVQAGDSGESSRSVLELCLAAQASEGRFAAAIHDAIADGVITGNEFKTIAATGFDHQETTILLLEKLRNSVRKQDA